MNSKSATRQVILFSFLLIASSTGCASLGNLFSGDSRDSFDAEALAKNQAALALKKGENAQLQGKPAEAIRYFEQARSMDAELSSLDKRLAVLYDQQGHDAQAHAAYERAIEAQPDDVDLLNDFGVYFLHREQWTTAEGWLRRALEVDPDHLRANNNLATALAMQNRLSESYEIFEKVVGPAAAYSNLGVLLTRQGRPLEARDHFQRALSLDQTIHTAHVFLGRLDTEIAANQQSGPRIQKVGYQARQGR